jgi:transposase
MANKTILMSRIRQILRLYTQGQSNKKISELTCSSRNTVKKYIHKFIHEHLTYDLISAMSDHELDQLFGYTEPAVKDARFEQLQSLLPDMEKQMKRKGMTITLIWEQYRSLHPKGYAITQFYKYYRHFTKRAQPVMHIEHKAGDKMYIDFTGEKLSITDKDSGEVIEVEVFVAILGCSQLTYVEAVMSQRKEDLIKACENALHYFGGVPAAIVPDNLKSAVIKSSKYEPVINETFADFAEHYATVVLPARAYRPKDKALVEGMVKIVYRGIYTAINTPLPYTSLEELNTAVSRALEVLNNTPFKGRDYSRRQQFEEIERPALQVLPVYRYEFKQQVIVTVMKNGHACLGIDKHYYSVPYRYIGKKVKLLYTSARVEIYFHYERIAIHARQMRKYHYTTLNEHLASAHQYVSDWTPEKFMEQARAIHEDVAQYITMVMEHKQHPEQAYKSCSGILSMLRKVGSERLAGACRRAHSYGVYNYLIILQILEKNLDKLDSDEPEEEQSLTMPQHYNIRGNEYYQ